MTIPAAYKLVSVRAFERPGYDGFCRGGVRWPSKEPRIAFVSPALLVMLKAERHLAVDSGLDPASVDPKLVEHLDIPPPAYVDEGARALEELARLDREIAAEKAKAEVAAKRAELESLQKASKANTPKVDKK